MKKTNDKSSAKPLIIVIISVLIIVIIGIIIAYALNQGEVIKEKEGKISKLQKKVNTLTDYVEKVQSNLNQQEEIVEEGGSIEYLNEGYKFSLALPNTWIDYKTEERILNFGNNRTANSVDFYFDNDRLVFNIGVISKNIWDSVKELPYYEAVKLGESNEYIFGYINPSKADAPLLESLESDLEQIKTSFQILQMKSDKVTWTGEGFTQELEADAETFAKLNGYYAQDKNYVYYADCTVGDCIISKLDNVDVDTFMVFDDSDYTKDKNHVYKGNQILEDADPETFEVMDQRYAKDKNHVYEYGVILEVVDPATFNLEDLTQESNDDSEEELTEIPAEDPLEDSADPSLE